MSKVFFFHYPMVPYFSVMSISSVLKESGHACDVFIEYNTRRISRIVRDEAPDIAAFPCDFISFKWAREAARRIKEKTPEVLTVFGGIHPTHCPEIIDDPSIDVICRGEGEYPMLELADALDGGRSIRGIRNLWMKVDGVVEKNEIRPLIRNLDELPFVDREIYEKYRAISRKTEKPFRLNRGCVYDCSYCHNHFTREVFKGKGRYFRTRSVDSAIAEIKEVTRSYRTKRIAFLDEIFWVNRKWLLAFLDRYSAQVGLPFLCFLIASRVDEDIIVRLKDAGLEETYLGPETGNERIRMEKLKKDVSNEHFLTAASLLHKHGIKFGTSNLLGFPNETLDDVLDTLELNWKMNPTYADGNVFQPFPKLALTEYALREGVLRQSDMERIGFFFNSVLDQPQIREVVNVQRLFVLAIRFPALWPVIKVLVKLPPNLLFDSVFLVDELMRMGYHNQEFLQIFHHLKSAWNLRRR